MSKIMNLLDRLFPICRSITGDGVRKTLDILDEIAPIKQKEYPTGMGCFDWTIPKEWNINDAYIKNSQGEKIVDFNESNLHVLGYSTPVHKNLSKEELMGHIYTNPEMPDAIPYLTSYYEERWGFCVEHNRLEEFEDDQYEVSIDSTLEDGYLTIGEGYIEGTSDKEILLSTYICHPSMANNELSGPIVQTYLYKYLLEKEDLKYNYRFLYLPETIGSIAYLSKNGEQLKEKLVAGYVITCIGDDAPFTYKKSRRGDTLADRAVLNVLENSNRDYEVLDWFPTGSDERQYCSLGFNLPVGSLMRSMYGTYDEYHTSLDNKDFISESALKESIKTYLDVIETMELNDTYTTDHKFCEPKLDKYGLYPTLGSQKENEDRVKEIMHLWAYADGENDIIDIANKLGVVANELDEALDKLINSGLLNPPSDK
ncbi:DUF4910 domain-containing protein [Halanaerobacter jeridensis]|uniref:Aminopeptidase-like protein n=1 Tax=Halanaerobacter jeridensis TaxID=706427 RepID=A0A938XPS0_9FIRM|nr:DUF4910 domain-containing protein [Halanaerobacter jeridensis]MBM7557458.1 aminopeptidase-like protein [Halanaerobacter jeridensis]